MLSALDAGRGDLYAGEYNVKNGARMLSERLLTRTEFVTQADGHGVVTADSALAQWMRSAGLEAELIEPPRADFIARLGWEKIQSGETIAPAELEANYIRRSDAEIFSKGSASSRELKT